MGIGEIASKQIRLPVGHHRHAALHGSITERLVREAVTAPHADCGAIAGLIFDSVFLLKVSLHKNTTYVSDLSHFTEN
jgi:hypothetical protein